MCHKMWVRSLSSDKTDFLFYQFLTIPPYALSVPHKATHQLLLTVEENSLLTHRICVALAVSELILEFRCFPFRRNLSNRSYSPNQTQQRKKVIIYTFEFEITLRNGSLP